MRALPTTPDARGPVLVPGDPEAAAAARTLKDGVSLNRKVAAGLKCLASRLKVQLPPVLVDLEEVAPKHYV
jgi:LDH2 family malate/lactate/ureidoglycolate dehydrogenase